MENIKKKFRDIHSFDNWFHEFFVWAFLKFSGPLCIFVYDYNSSVCLHQFCLQAAKKAAELEDWENWFSEQDKELQQIFQGQAAMREVLTEVHRKMDEIIGRQERTLSLISSVSQNFELYSKLKILKEQKKIILGF